MKPWRWYGPHPHYNEGFGRTVIRAYVSGRETFQFLHKKYNTNDFIDNVREDIKNGFYKVKVLKG